MKKFIIKLFPSFFNVTNVLDTSAQTEGNPFKIAIVEPDSNETFETMGIPEDRIDFLFKEVKEAMDKYDGKTEVLIALEPHIKHINEFYAVVILMSNIIEHRANAGIGQMFFSALRGGPKGNDTNE